MSIRMYQVNSNSITKKIRTYLEELDLDFKSIKICPETFTKEEFFDILALTESGVFELISDRSTKYNQLKEENFDFESLTLTELYELIMKYPTLLKSPIVINKEDNRLVVGNNMDLLERIVPKEKRK